MSVFHFFEAINTFTSPSFLTLIHGISSMASIMVQFGEFINCEFLLAYFRFVSKCFIERESESA